MQTYTITTEHFVGPFDLLLFFIERDELDINNIPIATITNDFLEYIHHLEKLNIDVASEFILVAATLMKIKAKLLIPRKELDEFGNEIDPREELAVRLLEYKKYKEILAEMQELEEVRALKYERGIKGLELTQLTNQATFDSEMESLTMYKLMQTFQKLLEKFEEQKRKPVHKIIRYDYTIEDQQSFIFSKLSEGKARFEDIFSSMQNRIQAVVTFLALLELLNMLRINILQGEGFNNFWLESVEVA